MSTRGFLRNFSLDSRRAAVREERYQAGADRFDDPASAPFNRSLQCQARDGIGEYILPFPCIRTDKGWYSARTMTPLHVTVTGWRYSDVR